MAFQVSREGKLVEKWSTAPGRTIFDEKNEEAKPVSIYNIEHQQKGLADTR